MKKILTVLLVAAALALVGAAVTAAGGSQKASRGVLGNETLIAYASTSGDGGNSGRIWSAEGNIEGLGEVDILVKSSWNWSFYSVVHPAALINKTTIDFEGCRSEPNCAAPLDLDLILNADLTRGVIPETLTTDYSRGKVREGHPDGFRTDATVKITTKNGDEINGEIVGGSVYEIKRPGTGGGGSINEWFISFDIVNGTGKFADADGTGQVHMLWDSGDAYSDTRGVYKDDPARFLLHEIFLHLTR